MRHNPHLYEINTRTFLRRLSVKYRRELTLATIPESEWLSLAQQGFDLIWLMGVWKRSPRARHLALSHTDLRREYSKVLPDWTEADIQASPYAVYEYRVDNALGKDEELAELKRVLNGLGMGLVLDFVPNHLALDHPWTSSHPDWFVRGNKTDVTANPDLFYSPDGQVFLAHGKDPYFPPWTDTAQVNFFSDELRRALTNELWRIADFADGVRCDMAMLALNEIFEKIWGKLVKNPRPKSEFWVDIIPAVRQKRPDFLFMAEVYWGLERRLQELGFDFVYDKTLYDKLRSGTATDITRHLATKDLRQSGLVRFIENHDEARAVTAFGRERSKMAAVVTATIPCLRLFHNGQLEGRKLRLPVQLAREPIEIADAEIVPFYDGLLSITKETVFHDGEWRLLEISPAWEGNFSHNNLLAWSWHYAGKSEIIVINYSEYRSQGRVKFDIKNSENNIYLHDELNKTIYRVRSKEVLEQGLYIELEPWQAHIFSPEGAS